MTDKPTQVKVKVKTKAKVKVSVFGVCVCEFCWQVKVIKVIVCTLNTGRRPQATTTMSKRFFLFLMLFS